MDTEWRAWRSVCSELESQGIQVNAKTTTPLMNALRRWGEEVAALRRTQRLETVARVLHESRAAYPTLKKE